MRTSKVHLSLSVAAALTLLSPVSAAERIVLSCSGTMFVPGQFGVAPVPDQSFIIDLDKGSVSSSLGDFSITKVTEDRVDFRANSGQVGVFTEGGVNRLTGAATVTSWRNEKAVLNYNLACKRTNPLF